MTSSETSKAARESRSSEANGSGSSNKSLIQRSNDPGCTFLQFQLPEDHISLAHARYQSFSITSVEEDSGDGTEEHEAEVQAAEIDRRFHRIINRIADREAFQEFNNMIYAVARARGGWLPSPVADVLDDVWLRHSAQDLDGPQWADLLAFDTEISKISPKKIGVKLRKLLGFPHAIDSDGTTPGAYLAWIVENSTPQHESRLAYAYGVYTTVGVIKRTRDQSRSNLGVLG